MRSICLRSVVCVMLALAMVCCVAAIKCNVNDSNKRPLKCELKDFLDGEDNCAVCTSNGADYGLGGCSAALTCAIMEKSCVETVKGSFTKCTGDGCNKCTSSSSVSTMCYYAMAAAAFAFVF